MDGIKYYEFFKQQKREEKAAIIIQRAWRRHVDIQVFTYYKNLIMFQRKGDPRILLKCIIPREAELLDAAAGIHVRFRLGGVTFPPNIYYKIFTHRPIADICANSPKDYVDQAAKQPLAKHIHNRVEVPKINCSGWYKRIENNGWRPLVQRLLKNMDVINAAEYKNLEFHYSRLRRKEEVEKRHKQRKIEWMRKMYYEGSLRAETKDPAAADLVQRATEGMIYSVEQHGLDGVMEWEVDELLKWTNALNFEEYTGNWSETGVSNSSCAWKGSQFVAPPSYQCD
ncbi:protein MFI isoform X1 [Microcaecilia unicolor]|uniref:Uncharacterized protein C11orf65 homolog isoform X1 n=1 Tax=Microcaecilia unicolor TaxID=1415580 RepID=A0A6P7XL50_9AMPH|nr:uncharacterized protein C11orf65 homolog isoform X1 [Microcaecilia unicolor]XP_030056132.1 uncharacterized protein C11orf65 homolog isoform X1 [Microcaecilia unicolor]